MARRRCSSHMHPHRREFGTVSKRVASFSPPMPAAGVDDRPYATHARTQPPTALSRGGRLSSTAEPRAEATWALSDPGIRDRSVPGFPAATAHCLSGSGSGTQSPTISIFLRDGD